MTYQQLYIDGQLVDIDNSVDVTLNIKSNIFGDVSKMVANKTYTIKLPMTKRNSAIFGNSENVKAGSMFPYKTHRADYFRDGVQIIKDGRAVVMSVGTSFELSIVWGLFPAFTKLSEDGITLNQLDDGTTIPYNENPSASSYSSFVTDGYGYADYNGVKTSKETVGQSAQYDVAGKHNNPHLVDGVWNFGTGKIMSNFYNTLTYEEGDVYSGYFNVTPNSTCTIELLNISGSVVLEKAEIDDENKILDYHYERRQIGDIYSSVIVLPNTKKVVFSIHGWSRVGSSHIYSIEQWSPLNGDIQEEGTEKQTRLHPSVTARYIFDKITRKTGINFDFDADTKQFFKTLAFPLVKKKNSSLERSYCNYVFAPGQKTNLYLKFYYRKGLMPFITTDDYDNNFYQSIKALSDCTLRVAIIINCEYDASMARPVDGKPGYKMTPFAVVEQKAYNEDSQSYDDGDSKLFGITASNNVVAINNQKVHITGYCDFELKKNDKLQIVAMYHDEVTVYGNFTIYDVTENVPYNSNYPIGDNLPQVKVVDFIKAMCVMAGVYPLQDYSENTIRFVKFDKIRDNRSNAVDWSSRLVADSSDSTPKELKTTIHEYAQNNYYKYKEDDSVKGNYDGNLQIYNQTLDNNREVMTLPFAATDGNKIQLYTKKLETDDDKTKTEYDYKDVKDRVLCVTQDINHNATLLFDHMSLQEILNQKYEFVRQCLYNAVVIKDKVMMSNAELLEFDETKPVYLSQYGAYFAVTEIKVGNTGIADVTMLKLKF